MRRWAFCFLIFPNFLCGDLEQAKKLFISGRYKETIKALDKKSDGESLKLRAEAYYKDQEHARAFEEYLKALDAIPKQAAYLMGEEEEVLYREALQIYLDPRERNSEALSLKLRDLYAGVWQLHPEYAHLGFLVAIAYANLGEYIQFFDTFYRSYMKDPEHF